MATLQDMADQLADDALTAGDELGDDRFYEQVAKVLLAASPTFNEAFMTSVRVRLAERRGRDFLTNALAVKRGEAPASPAPGSAPAAAPGTAKAPIRGSGH